MVDVEHEVTAAGKSILKRRLFGNGKSPEKPVAAPSSHNAEDCANTGKRYVTFNETISVKNEKDLIFKKPMKLEIVVENWKSDKVNTPTEIIEPNPGVVRRLVDEYNTIQEPLTEIDSTLTKEDTFKEASTEIQTDHILLCKALETINFNSDD